MTYTYYIYYNYYIILDFRQGYDSVDREQLWIVLQNFGLTKKQVNFVKSCNSNTRGVRGFRSHVRFKTRGHAIPYYF